MKLKILFSLIIGLLAISSHAQSESVTPKYGVVDIDSILMSIPETLTIYQKMDSVRTEAYKTTEPIVTQLQEKKLSYGELQLSGDSIALNNLETDIQILYQELNLIEQKTRRTWSEYQNELSKLMEIVKTNISIIGERLQLTLVIPKREMPVYSSMGLEIILESPLYYSGEAVDITEFVIKEVLPNISSVKGRVPTKSTSRKPI